MTSHPYYELSLNDQPVILGTGRCSCGKLVVVSVNAEYSRMLYAHGDDRYGFPVDDYQERPPITSTQHIAQLHRSVAIEIRWHDGMTTFGHVQDSR